VRIWGMGGAKDEHRTARPDPHATLGMTTRMGLS
jgi:hypothetical protein